MSNLLISLGWSIFAGGLVYWFFFDKPGDVAATLQYVTRTKQILTISAAVLLAGYAMKYLGRMTGIGRFDKCKRCGKRIDKGEIYCFDHRRDSILEAKERHRVEAPEPKRRP